MSGPACPEGFRGRDTSIPATSAESALQSTLENRTGVGNESRLQRWLFFYLTNPGALPQARVETRRWRYNTYPA